MTRRRQTVSKSVLVAVVAFYALPMISMARYAFQRVPMFLLNRETILRRWTVEPLLETLRSSDFISAAGLSLAIACLTALLSVALLVPTLTYARVALPRARPVLDTVAALPFVVPAIALVVGISGAFRGLVPSFIASDLCLVPFYTILALPFTYRAIDNALGAIDLPTMVDAARSLGANWTTLLWSVITPNILGGVATACLLAATLVLGEFTVASLLLKETLPLYVAQAQGTDPQGAFSVGLVLMLLSTVLLGVVNRVSARRGAGAAPGGI